MPVRIAVLVLSALALLATPAGAAEREGHARAKAERALEKVREARGEQLTPALRELFVRRAALTEADRRTADRYFARPTDAGDPDGDAETGAAYRVPEATPLCSPDSPFCIHYVRSTEDAPALADADGDGFPNYVERMLEVFEFVAERENAELGWPAAEPDEGRGGGPQLDVYIADIGDNGIYGYASPDSGQDNDGQLHAYQVMDDDYAEFPPDPDASLRVTAAHEYNHVLQFAANAQLIGDWAYEATATWMEDQVYPAINDYFQYIPGWAGAVGLPLTTFQGSGSYQYGSAVWNIFLTSRFGPDVVRDTWTQSVGREDALTAYDRVIPAGFAAAFGGFAAAVAEWRADPQSFADGGAYRDVPRRTDVRLPVDGAGVTQTLDHTSFQLLDVPGRAGPPIRLEATFPEGVAGEIALVGGPGTGGPGPVKRAVADAPAGGTVSVDFEDPAAYPRVTAVLANAGGGVEDDDAVVTARVITRPAAPPPDTDPAPTPAPTPVPTPTPTPTPSAIDTTGPAVIIPASNRSLRVSRSGLIRFGLGPMQENTSGVISLKTDNRVRIGGRRRILSLGTATFQALAGQRLAARIRLRKSVRRRLRALKRVRIQATLTVRDAAGNATTRTYRFTLRAPKRR